MEFCSKYFLFVTDSLEQYESKGLKKKRVAWSYCFRLCSFITFIRYTFSSIINKHWSTRLMADSDYLISNQRLMSMIIGLAALSILLICSILQEHETNYKLYLFDFLYAWKSGLLPPLNEPNTKRLQTITSLMTRLLMRQAFWPLVILTSTLWFYESYLAYMDESSGIMLITTLFFMSCFFIWLIQFYSLVCAGCILWTIPVLYFKYKFDEMHDRIQHLIKLKNNKEIFVAIKDHHAISIMLEGIDMVFKKILLVLYYVGSPALMMLVCVCQIPETNPYARPVCLFIVVMVYLVVFYLNLISSQISHSAAKPRKLFYRYLMRKSIGLTSRVKMSRFIEHLSVTDIGLHCLDIFSMNNFTFAYYLAGCASTYLLTMNLYYETI